MDLLSRIFSALGVDCMRRPSASPHSSPVKPAGGPDSISPRVSIDSEGDMQHCQCCVVYDGRLKRLSCGHLYCENCIDRIVNQAFLDIEGLSGFPCPVCKCSQQLCVTQPVPQGPPEPAVTHTTMLGLPVGDLQKEVIKEEEEEEKKPPEETE